MNLKRRLISILIVSILIISVGLLSTACLPVGTTEKDASSEGTEAVAAETGDTSTFANIFSNYGIWIWLVILAVAFYFLLIRPQRTRSKKAQELMSGLQRGDEIVTIGGFYGRIKDVRDDVIIITIAGGGDVQINKRAIANKGNQK